MRGDFVADDARPDILFIRQTKAFFGGYIAEHRCSEPPDLRRSYRAGDVVVARRDVGDERTQGVEGSLETVPQLFVHVLLDTLHRDMPGTFNHYLDVVLPSALCQLSESA